MYQGCVMSIYKLRQYITCQVCKWTYHYGGTCILFSPCIGKLFSLIVSLTTTSRWLVVRHTDYTLCVPLYTLDSPLLAGGGWP